MGFLCRSNFFRECFGDEDLVEIQITLSLPKRGRRAVGLGGQISCLSKRIACNFVAVNKNRLRWRLRMRASQSMD